MCRVIVPMSMLLDIYLNSSQIGWMDAECATYIHISFDAESAYLTDAVPLCEQFNFAS